MYVLAGRGTIVDGDEERPLAAGDVVFVAPNDVHQFRNTGTRADAILVPDSQLGHRQERDCRAGMRLGTREVSPRRSNDRKLSRRVGWLNCKDRIP